MHNPNGYYIPGTEPERVHYRNKYVNRSRGATLTSLMGFNSFENQYGHQDPTHINASVSPVRETTANDNNIGVAPVDNI